VHAEVGLPAATPTSRHPGYLVASRTAKRATRGGLLWGYVFGLTVASSAIGYASTYKTVEQRARLAALFGSNTALAAINGPAHSIETVAGYTVWKSFMFLAVVGGVWGLLTATRLLRGEEDAGRWELMLAGQTTRGRAGALALAGLVAGLATLWSTAALITVVVGIDAKVQIGAGPALFFALALVSPAAMFMAAGALSSQLAATRRQAATYAGVALGGSYAVRMVADSSPQLEWLRWATPIGWAEDLQPLTAPNPVAFVPIVALTAALAAPAVILAGRRDLGASVIPDRASGRPRLRLLSGPFGLDVRLAGPSVLAWAAGVSATALLLGLIANQGGVALTSSPSIENVVSDLGVHGAGATYYLGFAFLIIAVLVAFLAVSQGTAARNEESGGHLDYLLVRPVSRRRWLAGRIALGAGILIVSGLLAGFMAWAGAASQDAGVGLGTLLAAGLNVVPPALCILGVSVLTLGVWPRGTTAVAYGVLGWSFLVQVVGGLFSSNHWLLDTSVFHHMATAPAVSPDWASALALVGVGALAAFLGGVAFDRRDLVSE
jgi:ABC-2 type transport system permease protein